MLLLLLMLFAAAPPPPQPAPPAVNQCVTCHSLQAASRLSTPAAKFGDSDVHRERGFSCVDCHGGNASAADKVAAHGPAHGFKGKPSGTAVVATCARCHSDAELIRRFAPRQRVDQSAEYATSVHGKRLASGDVKVATCISCHGAHGIRLVSDAKSPVFATNVAATCASCHADEQHMAGYRLADGSPLPTTQFTDYQKSAHYAAMVKGNDLSAPTCNDCHGNHGAAPPGVGAITNVCGTCHAVFAQKFQTSVHKELFDKACVECHSNHAVFKPSDEMLAATGSGICASCHNGEDKTDKGAAAAAAMRGDIDGLKAHIEEARALVAKVKNSGIEVSDDELALRDASSTLTLARTEVHTFDPAQVSSVVRNGSTIVAAVEAAGERGVRELQYRRRGLACSLGAILLLVLGLALKVRQLDAHR